MQVLRLVLRHGLRLVSIGLVIGMVLALLSARALSSALYGVSAADATSFMGASFVLLLIGGLACYVPARTASKVDPLLGLRSI